MYRKMKWALIVLMILIGAQVVAAKGGDRITISGETLAHDIDIRDNLCVLSAFSDSNLEDLTTRLDQAPTDLGDSYLITRYTKVGDDHYLPFDQVRYYRDTSDGLGYVNYIGMINNGTTAYDGAWFRPTAQSAFVLKSLLGDTPAGMPDRAVISSGSLPHDIEITTDTCTLSALAQENLEDPAMRVGSVAKVSGSGYLITRYVDGKPYDQVRFYRDAQGGYGYVYDLGRFDGVMTDNTGQWFRPSAQSEYVIEQLLISPSTYNGGS